MSKVAPTLPRAVAGALAVSAVLLMLPTVVLTFNWWYPTVGDPLLLVALVGPALLALAAVVTSTGRPRVGATISLILVAVLIVWVVSLVQSPGHGV